MSLSTQLKKLKTSGANAGIMAIVIMNYSLSTVVGHLNKLTPWIYSSYLPRIRESETNLMVSSLMHPGIKLQVGYPAMSQN